MKGSAHARGDALRRNLRLRKNATRRAPAPVESAVQGEAAEEIITPDAASVNPALRDEAAAEIIKGGGVLPDYWIADMARRHAMIEPFADAQNRQGKISYGLSSYGYDARVSSEFKIFTNVDSALIDPKQFSSQGFVDRHGDTCVIPPNSFALARTVEYFRIPRDVLVICLGKSTYARCGIIVNVTPLEPEWEGHVTLEFSNTTPLPARIYANEGAAQFIFLKAAGNCKVSYADRKGKYMGQKGVTIPRL